MAIFYCKKCSYIREVKDGYIGKSAKCPKCQNLTVIYDTTVLFEALIKRYISQTKKLQRLKKKETPKKITPKTPNNFSFDNVDINNTDIFTQPLSYAPIIQWFKEKNIQVQINPTSIDTTGFFDEVSLIIGDNFHILSSVISKIKYIQSKGYSNVKIELSNKSQEEIQKITSFCKTLYDYSFVARFFYQKKDKIVRLTLQPAPKIQNFFNGIWMEWFVLMKLLKLFKNKKMFPALSRNTKIIFQNGTSRELDIFFLTKEKIPVCIECKSGEFRRDINKYLSLRKQFNISSKQFIICVFGLNEEYTKGMTSMYDVTFVNETTLIKHIETIL